MRRLALKSFPQFFAEGLAFCFRLCRIRCFPLDGALAERPGPRRKKAGLPKNLQNFFSRGLDAEFEACRMCVSSPLRRPSLQVEGRGSWTIEIADECGLSPAFEASLAPRGASRTLSSDDRSKIELKSLILAQIERWRHALHMQVERQRGSLLPPASGERVRNASGRADQRGITA